MSGGVSLKNPDASRPQTYPSLLPLPLLAGGTVFPLANTNDTQLEEWEKSMAADKYKQTRTCSPGLVVPPKKLKAVMWYNHEPDRGFLGPLNRRSLHGGCNVINGERRKGSGVGGWRLI